MAEEDAAAGDRDWNLVGDEGADLNAHDEAARAGPEQAGDADADADAGGEVEVVEEEAEVDDVHFGVEAAQGQVAGVEDVGREEGGAQGAAVAEEGVAQLEELAVQVGAVEVLAPGAVGDELAHVLREAAAQVQEGVAGFAEAGDEGRVVGREVDGEVEEEELPDAGVGVDVPGLFALEGGGKNGR